MTNNRSNTNLAVYYFTKNTNFGDNLNALLIKKVFNLNIQISTPYKCRLVAIGSLLESFLHGSSYSKLILKKAVLPKLNIWGTGFIAPENSRIIRPDNKAECFFRKVDVSAVRGELTKKRIEKMLSISNNEITIGDPGLLSNMLVDTGNITKKFKYGIIPHYVDINNPLVYKLNDNLEESTIINVLQDPQSFISQISQCENIISSAMHGLIAADSLRIPNIRTVFSDNIAGGDYKFNDYYSVYGLKNLKYLDAKKQQNITNEVKAFLKDYPIDYSIVIETQSKLLKSFPFI
ncbi:MAG: polysaccharide pyruvyl transferase family protein [Salinivirgaceae bacterium]|jgi:pyruvyltransferase|nr:polysaccharide pyruvyl transferase family protein [Salinivirgaceae bacterium]